jgi:hypothetical protein
MVRAFYFIARMSSMKPAAPHQARATRADAAQA